MPFYHLLILFCTIYTTVSASGQCSFNSPPQIISPFPLTTYLSFNESTKFVLDNYFTGVNLSFSYEPYGYDQPQEVLKTLQYTEGALADSLPQVAVSEVINVYWDDSNITSVSQQWTSQSLLLFLTMAPNGTYNLIVGSFDNIQASNTSNSPLYSSINIQPPDNFSEGSVLSCSQIAPVGMLQYYVDCTMTDHINGTVYHYFYYVSFPAYPPSNYALSWVPNNMTLLYNPLISSRIIISSTDGGNCTYLARYYNGLQLPKSSQTESTIEVFNVTDPTSPELLVTYNSLIQGYSYIMNVSSVQLSSDYMYVASAQGNIVIYSTWYEQPQVYQQNSYDQMIFQASMLRIVPSVGGNKESFIAVGSLGSVNLTAILFVSQSFQAIFSLPVPPLNQIPLNFQVFSVALGADFFGVSYSVASVAQSLSDSACYYYAIGDIMAGQSTDCHTIWAFEDDDYILYARMDPAAGTDVLFMMGVDNIYSNYSIFRPAFQLPYMQNTTEFQLNITSQGYEVQEPFIIIVLPPNDRSIYLDYDSSDSTSDALEDYAYQINSDYIVFLNQSVYGPELDFFSITADSILSYNLYQVQQIPSTFPTLPNSTFFAARRQHVDGTEPMLIIETNANGTANLRAGSLVTADIFNITSITPSTNFFVDLDIFGYFYVEGYEILLYNQNGNQNMLFLTLEDFLEGNNQPISASIDMYGGPLDQVILTQAPGGVMQLFGMSNSILYMTGFQTATDLNIDFSLSSMGYPFPPGIPFQPANLQVHWAYPNIVFVTTLVGSITYVVDFTDGVIASENGSDEGSVLSFDIIFAKHQADSYQDVIVQPFENNLFYIFPLLNVIEHWDLSVITAPFFRRNLELYSYNLTVLTSSFVNKGNAFSSTTDTLYLLAQDNNSSDNLYVLVLKPYNANAYIVQAIQLPFNMNNPQQISIDVTETQNSVYGNLLGDILVVVIGSEYHFWEVYSTPYLTFPVKTTDFSGGMINVQYATNFTIQNKWSVQSTPLMLNVYQNEKQISTSHPQINLTASNTSSLTIEVSDLWTGTVYNFSIGNQSENNSVSLTSYINFTGVTNFTVSEEVVAVLELTQYTYYLTSEEIVLINNTDPTSRHFIQILGPSGCTMYIDETESYGAAICGLSGPNTESSSIGFFPFSLTNFFEFCTYIQLNSYQDIFIDGTNSLMFLLMQAEGGSSNITVYSISQSICNTSTPMFVMQGWSFSATMPAFVEFDVLIIPSTQVIHQIFVLDLNFGLRVITYASLTNLVAGFESYSFSELYQYFGSVPEPLSFIDVELLEHQGTLAYDNTCTANLLIVTNNFHTLLLQFQLGNLGLEISALSYTAFLVPSDYWIDDYEVSGDLLILLGRNRTLQEPGLDMLAYNISGEALKNGLNTEDPTLYQAPIWVTALVEDAASCPEYPLTHPTISLKNDGDVYMLSFPDIQNQSTVTYNITNNITVSWNSSLLDVRQINFSIANNFQNVSLPIVFIEEVSENPVIPEVSRKWFYVIWGGAALGLVVLILAGLLLYRRLRRNRIQYSRKLQKDPLRELIL